MKPITRTILVSTLFFSACTTLYKEPTTDQPFATLHIKSNQSGLTAANIWLACTNDSCNLSNGSARLAYFSPIGSQNEKTLRVEPNKTLRIKAIWGNQMTGATSTTSWECTNILSFSPEVGHTYKLYQSLSKTVCHIELVDELTGKQPDTRGGDRGDASRSS